MRSRHGRQGAVDSVGIPRPGEVFTIVSGKGGVGKTNLALNLGIQLSRYGQRVIFVDADLGLANADILLNVSPIGDVSDLLAGEHSVEQLLVDGPEGLRVVCGVSGLARNGTPCEFDPGHCARAVQRLKQICDQLILDCGAGINPIIEAFADASDLLVLTTTPEPTALTDAYALLKMLHQRGVLGRVGAVVNMVRSERAAEDAFMRLRDVTAHFLGLELAELGYVPFDQHVMSAVQDRVPVSVRHPRCPASSCIDMICRQFLPQAACPPAAHGVWSRVASLFL